MGIRSAACAAAFTLLATLFCLLGFCLLGPAAPAADLVRRPAGAVVVPDHFLRQWDPVTVFFDGEAGPPKAGPEDHPERLLTLEPSHPGAFTWLDRHTLQFRPAVAWPPMGRFTWTVQGRQARLVTLMSPPVSTLPADDASGLEPVDAITLRFRDPIVAAELGRLVTIELRPLPGIGGAQSRLLDVHDFDIRALDRTAPDEPAAYVVALHHPIGWGMRAIVHIRLAPDLDQGGGDQGGGLGEEQRFAFSTAEPFHIAAFGCRDEKYPVVAEGVTYSRERALTCPGDERSVVIAFSDRLGEVGPLAARDLVHFSPQVEDLSFKAVGNTLVVGGRFAADTLYQLRLEPSGRQGGLQDAKSRPLAAAAPSQLYLSFPARPGFVAWQKGEGIAERFGPQMVPVKARGVERVDLRIHPIDPLDRALWPFPDNGVEVDETMQPPAPGEQPAPYTGAGDVGNEEIVPYIRAFGSPSLSELVTLPVGKGDAAAKFGLDLRAALARIGGAGKPGHYLIGIRRLDAQPKRQWMRLQVTDLSLTAVDESDHVRFAVTSLATGQPVAGAMIRIDGVAGDKFETLASLVTGADGMADWAAPGEQDSRSPAIRRVVVGKADDLLVLSPRQLRREYAEGGWSDPEAAYYPSQGWLRWTLRKLDDRLPPEKTLCHLFTERPIYRPDDPVQIKGYLRHYQAGKLDIAGAPAGTLVVEGPDGAQWRWPLELNDYGSFFHRFDDKTAATGVYKTYVEFKGDGTGGDDTDSAAENDSDRPKTRHCHFVRFKKEAYRLPKFEVQLQAPLSTGLDAPFPVGLTAEYYAGGLVADRPLHWRITQVPFTWTPKPRPGFVFSADQRFSGNQPFRSSPVLERDGKTDEHGGAKITLDPTIEPTAQPRKYIVEATVTGDDDQTVTNTQEVLALPPFVLGLKVPRFLERADKIAPEVLVEDAQGRPVSGQKVTVRLIRRQWNSILQASDFTQGSAKYVTEVVEDKVAETSFTSGGEPARLSFPIGGAAVYLVEVESQDKLGRLQTVTVDLFAGGDRPATWSRPPAEVFTLAPDKPAYAPGETAKLVLQSPFQNARALAVVEEPEGHNHYEWVTVSNGYGTLSLPIKPEYLPRVAVHVVLMRGRLPGDDGAVTPHADLRKPATLAATQWVTVTPVKNIVKVDLSYPRKALPGQEVALTVKLSDDQGKPLAGEVTLWMVDQAVLALAREQKLDPLPQFIVPRKSVTTLRDSRNLAFGLLPLQEEPGGDEGDDGSPLLRATVRKNFTPVPYYNPDLQVGPDGTATVKVTLPDSLTDFKLRAKAVSGPDRFGYGTGSMQVRLPVIVQPALPRFVRPGDQFELSAVGRVVEGDGGAGRATVKVDGLDLAGAAEQVVDWVPGKPQRVGFPVGVPNAAQSSADMSAARGRPERDSVDITVAVERSADGARDAFQVSLPILPDRDPVVLRSLAELTAGQPVTLPALAEAARPGSLRREVLVASPELAAIAGGLDYLRRYPFGCSEQRISQARADIGSLRFGQALSGQSDAAHVAAAVQATQAWLATAVDQSGLVAYWPGGRGYVTVTAWAVQFLAEVQAAGLPVDRPLRDRLVQALKQSLRSDYRSFIDGQSWIERSWALAALTAVGQGDPAYAAELARKAQFLSLENRAQLATVLGRSADTPPATLAELRQSLWSGIVTRLDQGREVYGGLQESGRPSPLILPSEARTLASVLRALPPAEPRRRLLTDALLRLGRGDGWGSTNADAEALLALAETLPVPSPSAGGAAAPGPAVELSFGAQRQKLALSASLPAAVQALPPEEGQVSAAGPLERPLAVVLRSRYLPLADGSQAAAATRGFAVDREQLVISADGGIARRIALDKPGGMVELAVGEVVEDHVVLANSADRTHVAVVLPLAAGMEPLNPRLATAPPEAKPSQPPTLAPSYVSFLDDKAMFFYDELPKGTYHFRLRSRATIPGRFIQPPAAARAMYDDATNGNGNGAVVVVTRPEK